ncbi:hypothetical protein N9D09_00950 [bacterium]|nr:hypothetical protein [bacterium]
MNLKDDAVHGWLNAFIQAGWGALSFDCSLAGGWLRMAAEQMTELIISLK